MSIINDFYMYITYWLETNLTSSTVRVYFLGVVSWMYMCVGGVESSWNLLTDLIVADFILGTVLAIKYRDWCQVKMKATLFKVILYWGAVAGVRHVDLSMQFAIADIAALNHYGFRMWKFLVLFLSGLELISILKKIQAVGIPQLDKLIECITVLTNGIFPFITKKITSGLDEDPDPQKPSSVDKDANE